MSRALCEFCGTDNDAPTYGDWECAKCGVQYVYGEGHYPVITGPMMDAARKVLDAAGDSLPMSPAEMVLRAEVAELRRQNADMIVAAKEAAYVVNGGTLVVPSSVTSIGFLFVYGGTVMQERPDPSMCYGLDRVSAN